MVCWGHSNSYSLLSTSKAMQKFSAVPCATKSALTVSVQTEHSDKCDGQMQEQRKPTSPSYKPPWLNVAILANFQVASCVGVRHRPGWGGSYGEMLEARSQPVLEMLTS